MTRRKPTTSKRDDLYRLTGPDTSIERNIPGSDGVALTWAVGVLCYEEGDPRPGVVAPLGEYLLTLVGPVQDEPVFKVRKHEYVTGRPLVSWEGA